MPDKPFSIDKILNYTSRKFTQEIVFLLGAMVLIGAVIYSPVLLSLFLEPNPTRPTYITALVSLLFFPIQITVQMGIMKIALDLYDAKPLDYAALIRSFPLIANFLIGSLIYGLILLAGLILLVVPAIIWAIRFQFVGFYIVDKKCGPITALKSSYALTRGHAKQLFVLGLLVLLIQIASIGIIYIGPVVAEVLVAAGLAYVYRKLLSSRPL